MKLFKVVKRIYQSSKIVHKAGKQVNKARKVVSNIGKQIYQELDDHVDFKETKVEIKQCLKEISVDQLLDKVFGWIIICVVIYFVVL